MKLPYWFLKLLPKWEYFCPACHSSLDEEAQIMKVCPVCGLHIELPLEKLKVPLKFLKNPKLLSNYVHKHIFPTLTSKQKKWLAQWFTIIFDDGFETMPDCFTPWDGTTTSGDGTITCAQDQVHHGAYSCKVVWNTSAGDTYAYKDFADEDHAYFRFYFRLDNLPVNNGEIIGIVDIMDWNNTRKILTLRVAKVAGAIVWQIRYRKAGTFTSVNDSDSPATADTWICVEIILDMSTADGNLDGNYYLRIDDVEIWSDLNIDTDSTSVDRFKLGLIDTLHDQANALWYDCVVIADTPIGEGPVCTREICLYVDGFDATKDQWIKTGNLPYLNWDTLGSIEESTDAEESGYYSFEDTGQAGTPTTVEIKLYCKRTSTGTITVYVHDGSSWHNAGDITPDTSYSWKTLNVAEILNTFTKINAAQIYVIYNA